MIEWADAQLAVLQQVIVLKETTAVASCFLCAGVDVGLTSHVVEGREG